MQTKKITELLELLDKQLPTEPWSINILKDHSGCLSDCFNDNVLCDWDDEDQMHKSLTYEWNQLTGDNLKDVTWVI